MYPNKARCIRCDRIKPNKPLYYSQTTEGKAAAKKKADARSNNGGSNELKAAEKENERLTKQLADKDRLIVRIRERTDGVTDGVAEKQHA